MFAASSCKEKSNIVPNIPEQNEDTTYYIKGITDTTISSFGNLAISLNLIHHEGPQQRVELSIEGLPEKVTAKFSNIAGFPGFNTILNLKSSVAQPGLYKLKIKATAENGLQRTFYINLTIKDDFNCNSLLVFKTTRFTTKLKGDSVYHFTQFARTNGNPSTDFIFYLYLGHYFGYGQTTSTITSMYDFTNVPLYQVDCKKGTITIPHKTINVTLGNDTHTGKRQFTVWGDGVMNYETNTITITYAVHDYLNQINTYTMTGTFKY